MQRSGYSKRNAQHWLAAISLVALTTLLICNFIECARLARAAILYPYELDYGEGIVWQQMRMIMAGKGYGNIDVFPAIVFHYPPFFHLVAWLTANVGGFDELAAGRIVSSVSALAVGGLIASTVVTILRDDTPRSASLIAALVAALIAFTTNAFSNWSGVMRVDMLCVALSIAGMHFGLHAISRPRYIYIASLLFSAAIFTKQTAIAAPTAVFLSLLLLKPKTAIKGILFLLAINLSILTILITQTNGEFLRHIVLYNLNRYEFNNLTKLLIVTKDYGLLIISSLVGLIFIMGQIFREYNINHIYAVRYGNSQDLRPYYHLVALLYILISFAFLPLIAKSGASDNYLIEWVSIMAIWTGLAIGKITKSIFRPTAKNSFDPALVIVPCSLIFQMTLMPHHKYAPPSLDSEYAKQYAQLVNLIRRADGPVISEDMVAVLRAGKSVQWEPAIFAELSSTGKWDEGIIIRQISAHQISFFVTNDFSDQLVRKRYTSNVINAIRIYYPHEKKIAGYIIHTSE